MSKSLHALTCLGLFSCAVGSAFADLTVSIIATSADPTAAAAIAPQAASAAGGFNLTAGARIGGLGVLDLLNCATARPCTVLFPSGRPFSGNAADLLTNAKANLAATDTLMFRDACGRGGDVPECIEDGVDKAARIEKLDTEVDQVQIKGLEITSLDDKVRTVTISVDTGKDNFAPPSGNGSRSYPVSLFFGGSATSLPYDEARTPGPSCLFKNPPNAAPNAPTACPGSQLTVTTGPTRSRLIDVKMPCDPQLTVGSANPCFADDDFGIADGSFATIRSGEVTCDGQCTPQHHAVVSTTFTKKGQSLMLLNSGVAAMARTEVEKFGVEALSHALAGEFKKPFWVAFTAANEYYQAQPNLPQDVNSSDDTMKLSFALLRTNPTKFQGQILLNSIGTPKKDKDGVGDKTLPVRERARNDRSYASFIVQPRKLRWKEITSLQMFYDVTIGQNQSGDPRLDSLESGPMKFSDCGESSVYVRVALTHDDGKEAGNLLVRLGSSKDFKKKCVDSDNNTLMSGVDLVGEGNPRVDASQISGKKQDCCMSVGQTQQPFGSLFVLSISLVVDPGKSDKAVNYQINLHGADINHNPEYGLDNLLVPDPFGYATFADMPASGRSIQISRVDGSASTPILTVSDKGIKNNGSEMVTEISVGKLIESDKEFQPGTQYRVDLCLFGGRCIPGQGFFTLH